MYVAEVASSVGTSNFNGVAITFQSIIRTPRIPGVFRGFGGGGILKTVFYEVFDKLGLLFICC